MVFWVSFNNSYKEKYCDSHLKIHDRNIENRVPILNLRVESVTKFFCDLQKTFYMWLKILFSEGILHLKTLKYLTLLKLLRVKDEKCEIGFQNFGKLVVSIKKLNGTP